MSQRIRLMDIGPELANLHEPCERAANDLIPGVIGAVCLKLTDSLTAFKCMLCQALLETNAPANPLQCLLLAHIIASQADTQASLHQLHQNGCQQSIQGGGAFNVHHYPIVFERHLIPGIEQHVPEVTDGYPVLGKLNWFLGTLRIDRRHQARSLFSASSAFFGLSNQYSLRSGTISVRITPW